MAKKENRNRTEQCELYQCNVFDMEFTGHSFVCQVFGLVLVRDCLVLGLCLGLAKYRYLSLRLALRVMCLALALDV